MKQCKRDASLRARPVRIVQFGEGNFLRGFVDDMVDIANEKGVYDGAVAIVKPTNRGNLSAFDAQDNTYTVMLRGVVEGAPQVRTRVVHAVQQAIDCYADFDALLALARCDTLQAMVSNTTEAGIAFDETDRFDMRPPQSFPGKLTRFLYERYTHFHGAPDKGLVHFPVELNERNGDLLRACVLRYIEAWQLEDAFKAWVCDCNDFCVTLVDRIITGYPKDDAQEIFKQLGYEDALLVTGEPFGLWVIEGPARARDVLPLDKAGLPVRFTEDIAPYRQRKVRVLNGAHTATVLAAYLAGRDIVLECMQDPLIRSYMQRVVFDEIVPTVKLPRAEVEAFAADVLERFANPFIKHQLLSIALNSVAKWRARILPSLKDSLKETGKLPRLLTFSLAALAAFYTASDMQEGALLGRRGKEAYRIVDDAKVLAFFQEASRLPRAAFAWELCARVDFWGEDLSQIEGFADTVAAHLARIDQIGMRAVLQELVEE
nr:tagaturonate reductase [Maliibacterium massiliense]